MSPGPQSGASTSRNATSPGRVMTTALTPRAATRGDSRGLVGFRAFFLHRRRLGLIGDWLELDLEALDAVALDLDDREAQPVVLHRVALVRRVPELAEDE